MSSTQLIGLSKKARAIVEVKGVIKAESGQIFTDTFGIHYPLYRYIFPNGKVLIEFIHDNPRYDGSTFFIALKHEKDGRVISETQWLQKQNCNCKL